MCLCGPINSVPKPFNHESITVSTLVKTLDATIYKRFPATAGEQNTIMAFITNGGDTLRYWIDGTAPTSTVGHVLATGDQLTLCAASLPLFQIIRSSSSTGDSVLSVTYFIAS